MVHTSGYFETFSLSISRSLDRGSVPNLLAGLSQPVLVLSKSPEQPT